MLWPVYNKTKHCREGTVVKCNIFDCILGPCAKKVCSCEVRSFTLINYDIFFSKAFDACPNSIFLGPKSWSEMVSSAVAMYPRYGEKQHKHDETVRATVHTSFPCEAISKKRRVIFSTLKFTHFRLFLLMPPFLPKLTLPNLTLLYPHKNGDTKSKI